MKRLSIALVLVFSADLAHAQIPEPPPQFRYRHGGDPYGIAMMPDALQGAVVGDGGRILWTETGGTVWNQADTPDTYRSQLRGIFLLDELNWYACGDGGAVLRSPDKGRTWTWINEFNPILDRQAPAPQPGRLFDIHMFDTDTGWVVGEDGVIARTFSGWTIWSHASVVPPDFLDQADPADAYQMHWYSPTEGLISCDEAYILRTTDGSTWTAAKDGSNLACTGPTGITNEELWSISADGDDVWVVGGYGKQNGVQYVSPDRGASWTGAEPVEFLPYVAPGCGPPTLYGVTALGLSQAVSVGYNSIVLRYTPSGTSGPVDDVCVCQIVTGWPGPHWFQTHPLADSTVENRNFPLTRIFSLSASEIWHTGEFGVVRKYDPQTGNWIDQVTRDYNRLLAGDFAAGAGCVVGQFDTIKKTVDSGATWSTVYSDPSQETVPFSQGNAIDLDANGYGIAAGTNGFVAYTSDLGDTWTVLAPPNGTAFQAACIAQGTSIAFIAGVQGGIAWTDLAASPPTWTLVPLPVQEIVRGIDFVNADTGYAVGDNNTAFRTRYRGANNSWTDVSGSTPANFRAVDSWGNGDEAIAVGEAGAILKKSSGSHKFQLLYSSPPTLEHLNDVQAVLAGAAYFAVGNNGVVVHGTDGSWTLPKSQTGQILYSCSFVDAQHGFLIGRRFGIVEYQ